MCIILKIYHMKLVEHLQTCPRYSTYQLKCLQLFNVMVFSLECLWQEIPLNETTSYFCFLTWF